MNSKKLKLDFKKYEIISSVLLFGTMIFSILKFENEVKATPNILKSALKRHYSDISGQRAGVEPPTKRQRVTLVKPIDGDADINNPDLWFARGNLEGLGFNVTVTSHGQPRFSGKDGDSATFVTVTSNGSNEPVNFASGGGTGWYQGRDIIWVDQD